MSIRNVAGMGWFSSDRTMREYAEDVWRVTPVPVKLG
jgi:starch phosphorylase